MLQKSPSIEVVAVTAELEIMPDQEVGMQGMDVDHGDEAAHMEDSPFAVDISDNARANVSNQSPCLSIFFDFV